MYIIKNIISEIIYSFLCFFFKLCYVSTLSYPRNHVIIYNYIIQIKKIFSNLKISYFIFFGALLGAIRQNAVAGSAKDLDIIILNYDKKKINKLKNIFINKGYKFKQVSKHQIQFMLVNKFSCIDIYFLICRKGKYFIKPKGFKNFYFHLSETKNIRKKKIYDLQVNIPKNYRSLLKRLYGNTWQVPNKTNQFVIK